MYPKSTMKIKTAIPALEEWDIFQYRIPSPSKETFCRNCEYILPQHCGTNGCETFKKRNPPLPPLLTKKPCQHWHLQCHHLYPPSYPETHQPLSVSTKPTLSPTKPNINQAKNRKQTTKMMNIRWQTRVKVAICQHLNCLSQKEGSTHTFPCKHHTISGYSSS